MAGNMIQEETSAKSLNEYKKTGFYKGFNFLDKPVAAGVSILEVFGYTSNYVFQRFNIIDGECSTYIRKYRNGEWNDWVKL